MTPPGRARGPLAVIAPISLQGHLASPVRSACPGWIISDPARQIVPPDRANLLIVSCFFSSQKPPFPPAAAPTRPRHRARPAPEKRKKRGLKEPFPQYSPAPLSHHAHRRRGDRAEPRQSEKRHVGTKHRESGRGCNDRLHVCRVRVQRRAGDGPGPVIAAGVPGTGNDARHSRPVSATTFETTFKK